VERRAKREERKAKREERGDVKRGKGIASLHYPETVYHPERSEGSRPCVKEILRRFAAQNDKGGGGGRVFAWEMVL